MSLVIKNVRPYGEDATDYRSLPQQVMVGRINAMGQILFAPPNVKGWPPAERLRARGRSACKFSMQATRSRPTGA